ncbi:MAG: hypothetical protein COC02_08720 [Rhodospirillaceae bacterium]|nr:MAG: hypothetical protein COC02_08720 [Rhodospirillaceae bacterium]
MTNDNNAAMKTPVQALEDRRRQQGDSVAMVQPLGGDQVRRYTWNEVADEAYRMAAYLKAEGIQAGDRVALVSKNCAEWIIADLAIWVAGGVSVPLYPTLLADSVRLRRQLRRYLPSGRSVAPLARRRTAGGRQLRGDG